MMLLDYHLLYHDLFNNLLDHLLLDLFLLFIGLIPGSRREAANLIKGTVADRAANEAEEYQGNNSPCS